MISPAIMARLRKYAVRGDDVSIGEVLGDGDRGLSEIVMLFEESVKLCAKAMTGGNITREDSARMSALCKMIGHEP